MIKHLQLFLLLSISLIFIGSINIYCQYEDEWNLKDNDLADKKLWIERFHETDTGFSNKQLASALAQAVNMKVHDQRLTEILKEISNDYKVNFVHDDQLIDVEGITVEFSGEKLFEVLDALLSPFDISYFEYETGKIVLAKIRRIDEKTGAIRGIVKDESGERLIAANVLIKELGIGCATDTKGHYTIKNIKPGEYTIESSFVGYEKQSQKIKIKAGEIIEINFVLKSTAFQIGGIEVVGTTELLPKDVNTKTVIRSGEIEHFQASSIKDVLDLVPGVQKTDNPGLSKTSQVAVRGSEGDQASAFGTMIIIDGTPVSNNANLQFERLTGSKFGGSNLGGGVDLRTIPADNIESIEVITGLPSVRYGDVTSGVINVQTKIGPSPHRVKIKNNPDTREGNIGGGFLIGESALNYNFNLAQSERDIRKTGDEYIRATGQLVYSRNLFENELNINTKFNFQTIFDEEEPKGDQQKIKNYNRGFTLGFSSWGKYKPTDGVSVLEYNAFMNMRRENSMKSRLIQSDLRILPNGDTVSIYLGKVETKGIEWTLGGRLEWNRVFYTGSLVHKFLIGTDPQYNANTGQGVIFDTTFNYYGAESGRRPYTFDDIPGQFLMNIYAEDKMTGHFVFDFNLMLGMRYEMYRPHNINLSGLWGDGQLVESHQGTFFNPRLNLMLYFSDFNQMRISAGTTSKSPAMGTIYPPETVFTWRNPLDSTVNYFRYDRRVPELKGYKEAQYEISYDHKFFNQIGTTISTYYKKRISEPEAETVPVFFSQTLDNNTFIYYLDSYNLSRNSGWTESKGIEFSLRTSRIKPLNMEFQIVGAYNFQKYSSGNFSYDNTPEIAIGQYHNYLVPNVPIDTLIGMIYPAGERWEDRFQLNYYIKYTCAPLGLWVTLRAEQLIWEKSQNRNQQPRDLSLLNPTQLANYIFDTELKTKPNKWLFNLNVSKALFPGAEVSFYVNNFLDDPALRRYNISLTSTVEDIRNPALSYGIEFSMVFDNLFRKDN